MDDLPSILNVKVTKDITEYYLFLRPATCVNINK